MTFALCVQYLLKGVDMVSVDPNPAVAIYGSSNSHLVDSLQNVGSHAQPDTFDMAIVNGVLGCGSSLYSANAGLLGTDFAARSADCSGTKL